MRHGHGAADQRSIALRGVIPVGFAIQIIVEDVDARSHQAERRERQRKGQQQFRVMPLAAKKHPGADKHILDPLPGAQQAYDGGHIERQRSSVQAISYRLRISVQYSLVSALRHVE